MMKFPPYTAFRASYCLELFMLVTSFRVVKMTDGFSIYHPTVSDANHRMKLLSENILSIRSYKDGYCPRQQFVFRLSASSNNNNSESQPIGDRSYDFIAIEEADKMLQQERLRNEQEIREMKILLERQHQELLEFDSLTSNVELSNQDYFDAIDISFSDREDDKCSDETNRSSKTNGRSNDKSPFSPPFSTSVDEEQYKQTHQRSHNTAEWRTLKISLQQIDEENEELEKEYDDERNCYQSNIEETQRMIFDIRDRFDCMQHELKQEISHFERAKAELEEMLEQERSKSRELEQELLVARREQEILEQAAVEAQQQQLQDQEEQEKLEEKQRLIELEHEAQEHHHQNQIQKEQEIHHHEELLRNHKELVELEEHQKQFDDVYFNIRNDNRVEKDNRKQNQSQLEEDVVAVNSRQDVRQTNHFVDSEPQANSPQPMEFTCHDTTHQQGLQQKHSFSVAVTTQASESIQSKKDSKRNSRKNSHAHGIFMNFNDILV